jgi:hypothetical protein
MERRKLLAAASGVIGLTATAGCITGGGGDADAGEAETLPPATDEPTEAGDSSNGGGGDATESGGNGGDESDGGGDDAADDGSGDDGGSTATESGGDDSATEEPTATATSEPATIEFDATIEQITSCGTTCRTLQYAIINRGEKDAPDVTVHIEVHTGGEKIWDNDQDIDDVGARSQRTGIIRDIDVGLGGGNKIKSNDGEVLIVLTPHSDGVSETFEFEETLDV